MLLSFVFIWFLLLTSAINGGISAKRQTAGIKFTHRPKISIFAPQGRLVAPIHVKFGTAQHRGTWVRLALQKMSCQSVNGTENAAPKWQKFPFLVNSRTAGANPLTDFYNVRGFYTPNYPALVFQIWHNSLYRLRSYWRETARRSIGRNFSVHLVGKTMRWIKKMIDCPFLMVSTCSFAIFLRGKAASRPFKLTSEMEFFYAITLFNFSRGGQVPPWPCLWAPMLLIVLVL